MLNYWYVWPIGIAAWLALGWIEFGYLEGKALGASAKPDQITLSMFVYTLCRKFPLALAYGCLFVGLFFGTLLTHFEWHWCPPGSISTGMLITPFNFN